MKDYSFITQEKIFTYSDLGHILIAIFVVILAIQIVKFVNKYVNKKQSVRVIYVPKKVHDYVMNRENCDITLPRNYSKNYFRIGDIICLVDVKSVNKPVSELSLTVFHKIVHTTLSGNTIFLQLERKDDIKIND